MKSLCLLLAVWGASGESDGEDSWDAAVSFFLVLWDRVRGVCVFGWKWIWGMGGPSILLWWFVLEWDVLGAVLAH